MQHDLTSPLSFNPVPATRHDDATDPHHGPSPVQRLVALLRAEGGDLWVVFVYAVGVGLLSLAVPVAVASLVNTVSFGTVLQPVVVLTFLVFLGLLFEGLMRALQFWVVELLQRRVFVHVAIDLAHRLPRVRAEAFDRANGAELVNRFFDVLTVQKSAASLLLDGLAIILQAVIGTLLLAFYHPLLLGFDLVLILGIAVILFPLGRDAIPTSVAESKAKYAVAAWLEELARHPRAFRAADASRFAARRADELVRNYLGARARHFRIVLRQHVGALGFKAILSAALLGLGGWLVINRGLSIGQLAAAELIVTAVVTGMTKFAKQLDAYYDLVTAIDKVGHLTDLPLERTGGSPAPACGSHGVELSVRDLSFSYDGVAGDLHDVNLTVNPGGRVAVLGRSGAGKSALADVIQGLRAPSRGHVRLDGADLRELSLDSVRARLVVVRDTEVFDGTVADNIALGRPEVTPERVRSVLAALRLDDAVAALPEGVHTTLQAHGAPLSSGEARRLMFARAIAGRPGLLVIDGALDAFDRATAQEILRVLLDRDAPWTLVVLTQHEEIAARCEATFTLRNGTLAPLRAHREG